ncbi:MAG: GNAT family N-acetyltransferase [Proteobacteria bacterium]|nr:MAG: GNAT family N-acetyltransferase [Pseudomonadota bacterium]
MKKDEPFNPEQKSSGPPAGLLFRLATKLDRDAIAGLMAERNPDQDYSEVVHRTDRELETLESDPKYRLFVADLNEEVLGFCRFYDSGGLPESRKVFPGPEGWYAMGTLIRVDWRRRGIARFLSVNRLRELRKLGATEVYSIVDSENLTSMRMHSAFGYEQVAQANGFLHLTFKNGGVLFRLNL